jgi:hypothetical protein
VADDPIRNSGAEPPSHPLASDEGDLEDFFRTGDEGTYAGGPSLPPVYSELEESAEPASAEAIAQRLERRARYQQLVTRLMSVLGVAALLALTLRATATRATEPDGEPAARPDTRLALAPVSPGVPAPAIPAPVAEGPPPTPPEAPAPAEPETAPEGDERPEPRAATRTAPTPRTGRGSPPPRAESRPPVATARATVIPRGSAHFPSASHAPPTANFPD